MFNGRIYLLGSIMNIIRPFNLYLNTEYTEIGGEDTLPLGREFQDQIDCFIDYHEKEVSKKYEKAILLIRQLS